MDCMNCRIAHSCRLGILANIYIIYNIIYILTFFLTYTRRQLCAILQFMQFILVFNVGK